MVFGGMKIVRTEFLIQKIRNIFACGVATSKVTTKWRVLLDPAHQTGLGNTSHKFSDSSNGLSKGGKVCLARIFLL